MTDALPTESVDENGVPLARDLTPGDNVKASTIITNHRYPDEILIGTNERDPQIFDIYRCNYQTGEKVLDTLNPGDVVGWGAEDDSFTIRSATVKNPMDSSSTVRIRDSIDAEFKDVFHFPYGEEGGLLDFCADGGKTGYLRSTIGRDTSALLKVDLATGETLEEIFSNDQADIGGVTLDKDTKEVRAVTYNYARTERVFMDQDLEADYNFLMTQLPNPNCEIGVSSRSLDETKWIISMLRSDGPTEYMIYDKPNKAVTPLFVSNPKLLPYKFSQMEDVRIPAHDGMELVGYLTRSVTEGPSPIVLLVHGGPWARDYFGFNPSAQWFANRGYATLQVNFRGSTGYGKSFLHKGDKQWGEKQIPMVDDLPWLSNRTCHFPSSSRCWRHAARPHVSRQLGD